MFSKNSSFSENIAICKLSILKHFKSLLKYFVVYRPYQLEEIDHLLPSAAEAFKDTFGGARLHQDRSLNNITKSTP